MECPTNTDGSASDVRPTPTTLLPTAPTGYRAKQVTAKAVSQWLWPLDAGPVVRKTVTVGRNTLHSTSAK